MKLSKSKTSDSPRLNALPTCSAEDIMFRIKKGAQDVITISDAGDVTFSGYYQENAPRPLQIGELRIAKESISKLVTVESGGGRDTQLEKRLFEMALLPLQGLQFKQQSFGVGAELHPEGDF